MGDLAAVVLDNMEVQELYLFPHVCSFTLYPARKQPFEILFSLAQVSEKE